MITINKHYNKLQTSYLFVDIARRVSEYQRQNPDKHVIKLGIGDVTKPLPPACIKAFHQAVDEMADEKTFRGYGPEKGYSFLRELVALHDFKALGAPISADEIFISDGAKCDTSNFQELFGSDNFVAIPDPVYPVYLDTTIMAGRTGILYEGRYGGVSYLEATKENNFIPALPEGRVDLIYLCFPNNPTGATISKKQLAEWVAFAHENKALILFDAAYEAFIRDKDIPHSIYEIDGAREVAVEFRSFSKSGGFTGTRCAYTVVPSTCRAFNLDGEEVFLHQYWNRRQTTKFNGVSYPVQKAAASLFSIEGKRQAKELVDYYMNNARIIRQEMTSLGYECTGGDNSPYIWIDGKSDSWEFFDMLLNKAGVVCTPGAGFGHCGEGYIRLSAFNSLANVTEAMERIKAAL